MEKIQVAYPQGSYPILIGAGIQGKVAEFLQQKGLRGSCAIVTDPNVYPHYAQPLAQQLKQANIQVTVCQVPAGEEHKNLSTVSNLYEQFIAANLDRKSTVISLGGGVIGDMTGFAAATYMRGVSFVQIPTTLLAMVDASVGGKTGVDLPAGKNLVGAFKQPEMVIIDPNVLQTLPHKEWQCGMAEVIKHGLIADKELLAEKNYEPAQAAQLIQRAVKVKVNIVQADPFEQGIRATLNLGHTFGHAIERVTQYGWLHGEAVGFGLLAAANLSHRLGYCSADLITVVKEALTAVGLPQRLGNLSPEAIYAAMSTDKKWENGQSRFILIREIGDVFIEKNVPKEAVIACLRELI